MLVDVPSERRVNSAKRQFLVRLDERERREYLASGCPPAAKQETRRPG